MKQVEIFTDGACRNNQSNQNVGGWGALLIYKNHEKEIFGGAKDTTNNIMELTAMVEALKLLKEKDLHISIYSDSAYIVNAFQERWMDKWILNGWKNSQKKPVENKEIWQELLHLVNSFYKVEFIKIKGHLKKDAKDLNEWYDKFCKQKKVSLDEYLSLVEKNNRVDELAGKGADLAEEQC